MARMKHRRPRKTAAKKLTQRPVTATKSAAKRRLSSAGSTGVTAKGRRARSPTVGAAAKRVLVSAGRTTKALARAGAERAARRDRASRPAFVESCVI